MWGEGGGASWRGSGPGKTCFFVFTDSELTFNITTQIRNNEFAGLKLNPMNGRFNVLGLVEGRVSWLGNQDTGLAEISVSRGSTGS